MPDQKPANLSATETISRAWKEGRPIVPFFGAGISVGAGFPLTGELREYFCKVLFYIRKSGYRVMLGQEIREQSNPSDRIFENNPSKYLASFGWPDFFRINADLYHLRDQLAKQSRFLVDSDPKSAMNRWQAFLSSVENSDVKRSQQIQEGLVHEFVNRALLYLQSDATRGLIDSVEKLWQIGFWKTPTTTTSNLAKNKKLIERQERIKKLAAHRLLLDHRQAIKFKAFSDKPECKEIARRIGRILESIPRNDKSSLIQNFHDLRRNQSHKESFREYIRYVQYAMAATKEIDSWAEGAHWIDAIVESEILELMDLEDSDRVRILEPRVWNRELRIRMDWFRLLLELVEGRMGLADLLFSTLNRDREPSPGHTTIAHLASRMGWPMILTLNHDTLLERAFQVERLPHKVFDISKDANVPDRAVIQSEWLSIIKLHGSSYGLRLGEPTNLELDTQTRDEILRYIPPRALIVVAGFSGYERRMMSLIEAFSAVETVEETDSPRIIWLHQESIDRIPHPVRLLQEKLNDPEPAGHILLEQIQDASRFFLGLYQSLTRKLPRSRAMYDCLPKRLLLKGEEIYSVPPTTLADDGKKCEASGKYTIRDSSEPLTHYEFPDPRIKSSDIAQQSDSIKRHIFTYLPSWDSVTNQQQAQIRIAEANSDCENQKKYDVSMATSKYLHAIKELAIVGLSRSPSLIMSKYVQQYLYDYRVIWIDIEDHHTIAGIVTEIADRMRIHDPSIPPLLLPVALGGKKPFGRAIRYLKRSLRRGKYVLAFDSIEGFGRNQTSHHGLIRFRPNEPSTPNDFHNLKTKYATNKLTTQELLQARPFLRIVDLISFVSGLLDTTNPKSRPEDSIEERDDIGNSIVCASIDVASMRHEVKSDEHTLADEANIQLAMLTQKLSGSPINIHENQKNSLHVSDGQRPTINIVDNLGIPYLIANSIRSIERMFQLPAAQLDIDVDSGQSLKFLVFQILIIFRRPRSIASIQWTVKRFLDLLYQTCKKVDGLCERNDEEWRAAIDNTIQALVGDRLINEMEGGYFWIEHHTHEFAYKLLTRPFWEFELLKVWEKRGTEVLGQVELSQKFKQDLLQCLFCSSWNSTVARFYYVHAFQRSGDVNALFEYIYHRICSLRHLRIASLLIVRSTSNERSVTDCDVIDAELVRMFSILESSLGDDDCRLDDAYGSSAIESNMGSKVLHYSDFGRVQHTIDKLRARLFRTLINVFDREQVTIFRTASADTWLNWIDALESKAHDIYSAAEKEQVVRFSSSIEIDAGAESECADIHADLSKLAKRFRVLLLDMKAKLLREKGDYEGCLRARFEFLSVLTDCELVGCRANVNATLVELVSGFQKFTLPKDKLSGIGELSQDDHPNSIENDHKRIAEYLSSGTVTSILYNCCSDLASCFRRSCDPTTLKSMSTYESIFRQKLKSHESSPKRSSDLTVGEKGLAEWAFSELPNVLWIENSDERAVLELLIKAERIRTQVDEWDPWCHSSSPLEFEKLLPTILVDIAQLESRVYGAAFRKESDFSSILSEVFGLRGWVQTLGGSLEEGMYSLGEALNGLHEDDLAQQFHISVIRRRLAHCLMQDAHRRLDPKVAKSKFSKPIPNRSDCDFAQTRLREAAQELTVVERILKRGRRNVRAWKHLYRAKAQLEIERLLLLIQRIQSNCLSEVDSERFAGIVQERLLAGLEAIRGGLDCAFLDEAPTDKNNVFEKQVEYEVQELVSKWIILFVLGRFTNLEYLRLRTCALGSAAKLNSGMLKSGSERPPHREFETFGLLNKNFKINYWEQWLSLNSSTGIDRLVWYFSHCKIEVIDTKGAPVLGPIGTLALQTIDFLHEAFRDPKNHCVRAYAIDAMQKVLDMKCKLFVGGKAVRGSRLRTPISILGKALLKST